MKGKDKNIVILLFLAIGLRTLLFAAVWSGTGEAADDRVLAADGKMYRNLAVNLIEHSAFSNSIRPPYTPNTFRTPVYPAFLAAIYSLFGYKLYIPVLCQIFFSSFTCIVTYRIGAMLFNEKVGFFAGVITAIEYSSILFANILITDTLFTLLFAGHIYYLTKFLKTDTKKDLIYSALFLGFSTLCRPVSVYFFLFLIWIFILNYRQHSFTWALKYFTFCEIFVLTLLPWIIRNYNVSGQFLVSSIQQSVIRWNLPQTSHALLNVPKPSGKIYEIPAGIMDLNENIETNAEENVPDPTSGFKSLLSDSKRYVRGLPRYYASIGSSAYPKLLALPTTRSGKLIPKG